MGQFLHESATTTEAIRRAIQHSEESLRGLAKRYGINQKTVAKWKRRTSVAHIPTGPKDAKSAVLSIEEEAIIVAFRRHTLLPLDDCLYALQVTIPHLTRSSLHRCLQHHDISRLTDVEGDKPSKRKFKSYPIGYFHIDIAEAQTEEGKLYLFVAIDRTSKFVWVELHNKYEAEVRCFLSLEEREPGANLYFADFSDSLIQRWGAEHHYHCFKCPDRIAWTPVWIRITAGRPAESLLNPAARLERYSRVVFMPKAGPASLKRRSSVQSDHTQSAQTLSGRLRYFGYQPRRTHRLSVKPVHS